MDLFLTHSLILVWASLGAARQLFQRTADRLLAAALFAWGNLVVTGLLLSLLRRLGQPAWFLGASVLLALLTCLVAARLRPEPVPAAAPPESGPARAHPGLIAGFILTLLPLAYASIRIAWAYPPGDEASFTYQLPRALYYLGQDNLAHFDATDLRQTHLPFNSTLLQLFGLVYSPPLQCLNFFNLVAWAASGIAGYRLCRLCALGPNVSLIACWLASASTPVLAQATAAASVLPAAAAAVCAVVFFLRWSQTRLTRDLLLAGLATGLAAGSRLDLWLLSLVVALVGTAFARRRPTDEKSGTRRPWLAAGLLAGGIGSVYLLINLAEPGSRLNRSLDFALRLAADADAKEHADLLPLWRVPLVPATLDETTTGFGLTGPFFLVCGVFCLIRYRKSSSPLALFACLGLGWVLTRLLCSPLAHPGPGDFMPALLLLVPCAAAVLAAGWSRGASPRFLLGLVVALTALSAGWSAKVYLISNTSRPLAPLLNPALPPPTLPALPLLVEYHLAGQTRINIDTDGVNESIFPFMAIGRGQRFTSRRQPDPEAYNLLSRVGSSRHADYLNATGTSYVLLAVPSKPTAGVELLATRGPGAAARDYFGIERHAGRTKPVNSNRSLLITLYPEPRRKGPEMSARIMVAGLNSEDGARLVVVPEYADGPRDAAPLATFHTDGEAVLSIPKPFHRLLFAAVDEASGANLGIAAILYQAAAAPPAAPIDRNRPTSANSIFVTDLVLAEKTKTFPVEGLLPVEGPFPQWDLPFLRWAREPAVRITLPPFERFTHLQLSFSVRLHVRKKAALDVLFNGQLVQRYRITDSTVWLDETLELSPQAGPNVLEFKDGPINDEPDWLGYLELYPDVKSHVAAGQLPPEQGAREHYETNGRTEGRTLPTIARPEPAPDGYYFMFRNIRLEGFARP